MTVRARRDGITHFRSEFILHCKVSGRGSSVVAGNPDVDMARLLLGRKEFEFLIAVLAAALLLLVAKGECITYLSGGMFAGRPSPPFTIPNVYTSLSSRQRSLKEDTANELMGWYQDCLQAERYIMGSFLYHPQACSYLYKL